MLLSPLFKRTLTGLLVVSTCLLSMAQLGCASGGFKLTRQYARFVNKQQTVIRVVLYLLTMIVFAATILIDAVIFNTMDFWEGRVSANSYHFNKDGKIYGVKHYHKGDNRLRNTEIRIYEVEAPANAAPELVHLSETDSGKVDIYKNGALKATVDTIQDLPEITLFEDGEARPWRSPQLIAIK